MTAEHSDAVPTDIAETAIDVAFLAGEALCGNLVMYVGAGISIASPSDGPRGNDVADRLRTVVADMIGGTPDDYRGASLESLASAVQAANPALMMELRQRAAGAVDFRGMLPNQAHEALAILLREGLVQVLSVNWDCAIESAGMSMGTQVRVLTRATHGQEPPHGVSLRKIHGCANDPSTLALTQEEVDQPLDWAITRVRAALDEGTVVFLGLGTVGNYVQEPVSALLSVLGASPSNVRVVDPFDLSEAWRQVLGERINTTHVRLGAAEFLTLLLKELLERSLRDLRDAAYDLESTDRAFKDMVSGATDLVGEVRSSPPVSVLRWLRNHAKADLDGRQFLGTADCTNALLAVAGLTGKVGTGIQHHGRDDRFTLFDKNQYYEVAYRPAENHVSIVRFTEGTLRKRLQAGVYVHPKRIRIITIGGRGSLPARSAPVDIAAGPSDPFDIAEQDLLSRTVFVRAEDVIAGREVA